MNLFNAIKLTKPKNNVFDLSHDVKLSLDMGNLVPTLCLECVPGDKFNIGCDSLLRFAPLVAPVMHRIDVYMHYFFVPNRILWPNWENYITNTKVAGSLPAFPTFLINSSNYSKLHDYLGIPTPLGAFDEIVSAFPQAAYQKIFNEYYRDQNLQTEVDYLLSDGSNTANTALNTLRKRAWDHDYFTAALPFAQKGDPVGLPLAGFNDVPVKIYDVNDRTVTAAPTDFDIASGNANEPNIPPDTLFAETSGLDAGTTTINDLRRAFRLQEWLEKAARGGSRYIENILSHFGVRSSDKRLQRPEYITGTKSPVIWSEVLNTSDTATAPQGNMAGHGVSVTQGSHGSYYCEEHGYIIGIMSVLPKTAYQQGIARHFLKTNDPFEFYWPSFANIGEQEIKNRELYAYTAAGDGVFGYIPRYAEYKYIPSRVAGDFRNTLNFWHEGRIFTGLPALNEAFISANPSDRIFAVTGGTDDHLYAHVLHKIRAVRSMPKFGTPSF